MKKNQCYWYLILEHAGNIKTDTVSNDLSVSSYVVRQHFRVWCHFGSQCNTKVKWCAVTSIHRSNMNNWSTRQNLLTDRHLIFLPFNDKKKSILICFRHVPGINSIMKILKTYKCKFILRSIENMQFSMSLVSFSDNFAQISLYKKYQSQWQYISKFD